MNNPTTRKAFDRRLQLLLEEAVSLIPAVPLPDPVPGRSPEDTPAWHPHELRIWALGEEIRQLLVQNGKLLNEAQVSRILTVCQDNRAGRGRQSFVMLLGRTRYAASAPALAPLLSDPDICGQVINVLYKMRAASHAAQIRPFADCPCTWIRNEAKRYLAAYDKSQR